MNRRVRLEAGYVPLSEDANSPKRRTWEGYADDYRELTKKLAELSERQQELERELAEKARLVQRLKQRRAKDLERLAQVSRSRDLLERRTSAQMAKVAAAMARAADNVPQSSAPAQPQPETNVSSELTGQQEARTQIRAATDERTRPDGWFDGMVNKRWWRSTIRRAHAAHQAGSLVDAQILFEAALVIRATWSLWGSLGHVLREQNLFEAAERAYEKALQLSPDNAEILFLSGYCAEMSGRKDKALVQYEAALQRDPQLVARYDHLRDFRTRLAG